VSNVRWNTYAANSSSIDPLSSSLHAAQPQGGRARLQTFQEGPL
jgi:hypothetical protein